MAIETMATAAPVLKEGWSTKWKKKCNRRKAMKRFAKK